MTAVSPVDRAPMEILLRIFSCLVPSPQYCWEQMARTYQDQVNVPMIIETIRNVRAVCSTWRNLVYFQRSMAVPLVIDLDDKGQPKQPLRPILQLVQMQETLPLVAAVLASPHSSTPMTTLAIAHALRLANNFSHRLTHFIIRLDGLHQSPFPAIYAPQLTHLLIRRDNCPTSYNYGCAGADRQHALEFIRAIDAPQLQVLDAAVSSINPSISFDPFFVPRFGGLTVLNITTETLTQLAAVLNALPTLECVATSVYVPHGQVDLDDPAIYIMPVVHLPRLTTWKYRGMPAYLWPTVGALRSCSQLRELYVSLQDGPTTLPQCWQEIPQIWPNLTLLALSQFVLDEEELLSLVRALPLLTSLALEAGCTWHPQSHGAPAPVGSAFLRALVAEPPLLPNLSRFAIYHSTCCAPPPHLSDVVAALMSGVRPLSTPLQEFTLAPACCRKHIDHPQYADERALQQLRRHGYRVRLCWNHRTNVMRPVCAGCAAAARPRTPPVRTGAWEEGWGDWEEAGGGGWGSGGWGDWESGGWGDWESGGWGGWELSTTM
ncbi:hypothetical protein EV714DRAFT_288125 [Schizophyllum commune]